ncbi:MAG: GNAT family N-acetyltransferase [Pseudomonadota bacterium]
MPHTLRTPRLILRERTVRDAPKLHRAVGRYEVLKMTATWPWPASETYFRERLAAAPTQAGAKRGFALVSAEDGSAPVVGDVGGGFSLDDGRFRIGYMLSPAWAGRGLATEALRAVCRHFFRTVRLRMIWGECYIDNPASARVMLKAGFNYVGPAPPLWSAARGRAVPGERFVLRRERYAG